MKKSVRTKIRGQVAVETAIVMPLFVFVILGLLQLTLMHQAQLMTKYAAYKAVRAGSIGRGKVDVMRRAALNVLVPVAGRGLIGMGNGVYETRSGTSYVIAYNKLKILNAATPKIVDVTICSPLNGNTDDFDNPLFNGTDVKFDKKYSLNGQPDDGDKDGWKTSDMSKLSVQVTLNYRMSIPFVNGLIWWAAFADEHSGQFVKANQVVRLSQKNDHGRNSGGNELSGALAGLASQHIYVMPIRAGYAMRMQSNFEDAPPTSNNCKVWFK